MIENLNVCFRYLKVLFIQLFNMINISENYWNILQLIRKTWTILKTLYFACIDYWFFVPCFVLQNRSASEPVFQFCNFIKYNRYCINGKVYRQAFIYLYSHFFYTKILHATHTPTLVALNFSEGCKKCDQR